MGTRSLTYVYDGYDSKEPILCFYQQYDGYLEGVGTTLAVFLARFTITGGFNPSCKTGTHANGAGCLAAQLIAAMKDGVGGLYIQAPALEQDCGQEFEYHIFVETGRPVLLKAYKAYGEKELLIEADAADFVNKIPKEEQ